MRLKMSISGLAKLKPRRHSIVSLVKHKGHSKASKHNLALRPKATSRQRKDPNNSTTMPSNITPIKATRHNTSNTPSSILATTEPPRMLTTPTNPSNPTNSQATISSHPISNPTTRSSRSKTSNLNSLSRGHKPSRQQTPWKIDCTNF